MAEGPGGVRAALEQVLDGEVEDADAVQAVLFDDLTDEETGALDAPSPLSAALPAKRGRRKGSRNRRTEAVVSWLLAQHRHPLSVMMEAYSMTPQALADRLGLVEPDLLEVFKLQLRMAEAVAPYVAQRQPQAVQVDARSAISLSFEGVSLPARGEGLVVAGEVVEGLRLPFKSDADGRTDGETPMNSTPDP